MKRLSEGERGVLAELNQDATLSISEQVADWAGIPLDEVMEDMMMAWQDTMRDEAAEGWGTP